MMITENEGVLQLHEEIHSRVETTQEQLRSRALAEALPLDEIDLSVTDRNA
jgi:hypothetical protein